MGNEAETNIEVETGNDDDVNTEPVTGDVDNANTEPDSDIDADVDTGAGAVDEPDSDMVDDPTIDADADADADTDIDADTGIDAEKTDTDNRKSKPKVKQRVKLIESAYTRRLPNSLFAALIGTVFGMILPILCAYYFGATFYPFYIATPLLIYILNALFRGCRDVRSLIVNAVFSFASTYLNILVCRVALIMCYYQVSITRLPPLTVEAFGIPDFMPLTVSSYIYPLLFTALGVAIVWELLRFNLSVKVPGDASAASGVAGNVGNAPADTADGGTD